MLKFQTWTLICETLIIATQTSFRKRFPSKCYICNSSRLRKIPIMQSVLAIPGSHPKLHFSSLWRSCVPKISQYSADPGTVFSQFALISVALPQRVKVTQERRLDSGNGPSPGLSSDKHGQFED